MVKYCPSCGDEVKAGYKFCLKCGSKIDNQDIGETQAQAETFSPIQQQTYPTQLKKPNFKLIAAIVAIIVIVAVVAVVLFVVLGGGSDSRFVGTWNISSGVGSTLPTGSTMIFESNGDLKVGSSLVAGPTMKIGTWSVEGGKVCLSASLNVGGTGKQCASYSFSDGGNTLTIYDPTGGTSNLILTK